MSEGGQIAIVLIETLSNQAFIFASNKLREVIGASELVYRCGTRLVLQHALPDLFYNDWPKDALDTNGIAIDDAAIIADRLADEKYNPCLSKDNNCHIMIATSGKAIILCKDKKTGINLVAKITRQVTQDYPGLGIMGAVHEFTKANGEALDDAIQAVHHRLDTLRGNTPPQRSDLARLPFTDDCASTGSAAAGVDVFDPDYKHGKSQIVRSAPVLAKRNATQQGITRLNKMFKDCRINFAGIGNGDPDTVSQVPDVSWTSAIHADGNGIGQVFLDFSGNLTSADNNYDETHDGFIKAYRNFSAALDEISRKAAVRAFQTVWPECCDEGGDKSAIFRPVVIAGDDLTVLTDGEHALSFAVHFARYFEKESQDNAAINFVMGKGKVSVGAGIAVFKEHAPFHRAYGMAESLCTSAKSVKDVPESVGKFSGIDFHVSYDGGFNLEHARSHPGRIHDIHGGPYVLSANAVETNQGQMIRPWNELAAMAGILHPKAKEGNARNSVLPSRQQHILREAANLGPTAVDAKIQLIYARYDTNSLWETIAPNGKMFSGSNIQPQSTAYCDALVANDVCVGKPIPIMQEFEFIETGTDGR